MGLLDYLNQHIVSAINWSPLYLRPEMSLSQAIALFQEQVKTGWDVLGLVGSAEEGYRGITLPDLLAAIARPDKSKTHKTPLAEISHPCPPRLSLEQIENIDTLLTAFQQHQTSYLLIEGDEQQIGYLTKSQLGITPTLEARLQDAPGLPPNSPLPTPNSPPNTLDNAQKLLQSIARTTPGLIYLVDYQQNCLVYHNHGIGDLLGYSSAEITARGANFLTSLIHPDDQNADFEQWQAMNRPGDSPSPQGESPWTQQLRLRTVQGEYKWVLLRQTVYERQPQGQIKSCVGIALDIHALKVTEELLQLTEERLRFLLESSPVVIYTCPPQVATDCTYISKNVKKILGYGSGEFISHYGFWQKQIHPEDRARVIAGWEYFLDRGNYTQEYRFGHAEGHYLWIRDERQLIRDSAGQAKEVIGSVIDISDRKQVELSLQASEKHLNTIVSNISDGIIILDRQGQICFANPMAGTMLNLRPEEVKDFTLGLPPDAEGTWEMNIVQANGNPGTAEVKVSWVTWEGESRYLMALRDITRLQADAQKVRESERRYRTLMESVPNLIWLRDQRGRFLDGNERLEEYLGLSITHLQHLDWYEWVHPQDWAIAKKSWQVAVEHNENYQKEYRLRGKDGRYRWHLVQATPLTNVSGNLTLWLGSCTDIEALKRAETVIVQQAEQERLLTTIAQRIRQSLELEQILKTTVGEVRDLLKCDRVLVYRVYPQGSGKAIAESVGKGWEQILHREFPEEVFPLECYDPYFQGRIFALDDRSGEPERGTIRECLVEFLADIQVRAKLVVPIVQTDGLWGLLIAHQCSGPRHWQEWEIQFLQQLSDQISIAIQQSLLYERLQQELAERQQAETQLRQVGQLQQAILDGANYSIISVNLKGVIQSFNKGAEKLLGYWAEEVIGQETPLLFHDPEEIKRRSLQLSQELRRKVAANFGVFTAKARLGVTDEHEWTYIHRDGTRIPVLLSVNSLLNEQGQCSGYVGIASNLSERKAIEAAQHKLELVVKNTSEFIAIADLDQNITFLNESGQKLVGIQGREAVLNTRILDYYPPQEYPLIQETVIPQILTTGYWEGETYLRHFTTEQLIPVLATTFTIPDTATGLPTNFVAIMRDITHIKQAEQRILTALDQERELSELRSRFISMASHEFRTPLAIIASSTGILEMYQERLTTEKRIQHLHRIKSSIHHMTDLLDDVLLVSRAESERLPFNPTIQDLRDFCDQLVAELQLSSQDHTIQFQVLNPDQNWEMAFDTKLLRQILTNLLSNALKYSPQGGDIQLRLSYQAPNVCLEVQDQGMGIPAEDLGRLFTPFHRAHNVGNIQGTGLGLTIIKKCAELHQGTVEVESELGQGTCFTVKIPCNSSERPNAVKGNL
ncbi:MAG: PAS domain S-box protein [Microcystaceae cyanobacterium]